MHKDADAISTRGRDQGRGICTAEVACDRLQWLVQLMVYNGHRLCEGSLTHVRNSLLASPIEFHIPAESSLTVGKPAVRLKDT